MKRFVALAWTLALCLGLCAPALAAEFSDVPAGHAFYDAIMDCAEKGIVGGYEDGTFRPANTVTNASFVAMLTRRFFPDDVAKWDTNATRSYMGVFGPNLAAANTVGILEGTSFRTSFSTPESRNKGISRYDMAQLMTNIMGKKGLAAGESDKAAAVAKIADYADIPGQYRDAVTSVYALGMIGGYADGTFGGEVTMNRGQAAVVIYRLAQYMGAGSGAAPEDPAGPASGETTTGTPETPAVQTLSNGKPVTVENVVEIMNQLREQYPEGTDTGIYGNGNMGATGRIVRSYTNDYGRTSTSTTSGCGGWAARVFDAIWGYDVTLRRVSGEDNGYYNARVGDLVIIVDEQGRLTHVAVVCALEYDDLLGFDVVFTTDANYGAGANVMAWDHARYLSSQSTESISISDGGHTPHFYTAYPD